jgi:hypothetical protein
MWKLVMLSQAMVMRRDVPTPFARFMRSHVQMHASCTWTSVDPQQSPRVMDRYFGTEVCAAQTCEVFLIEGVPAAAMLYTSNTTHGMPVVDSFHFNKGLLLLFDAGSCMRSMLYRRYPRLNTTVASHRVDFLTCP